MKTLHAIEEFSLDLQGAFPLTGLKRDPEGAPSQVVLLLHGLNERGRRIYRKLIRYLPEDALVLAPNAPWPIPRQKPSKLDFGHAWYYYDRHTQTYPVTQQLALELLVKLLMTTPKDLPVTIIGFSQGGYLAPQLGFLSPRVDKVIGIGCEFRERFFPSSPSFQLHAIHGSRDEVITPEMAQAEIEKLNLRGIPVSWTLVDSAHDITEDTGRTIQRLMETYGKRSL